MAHIGGGIAPESAQIEPLSELKYRNIVKQAYDYSCGSAALVTLLNNYLGIQVTEQQAMEGMLAHGERDKILARRGFSLLDMKRYVLALGAGAAGFRGDISDLAQLEAPVIVPIDYAGYKHFVVLRGIRDGKAFLADPSAGHIVLSVDEFAEHWDGNTLFMVYAPEGGSTISKLALADRELGVFDQDRVRRDSDLSFSTTDMLNRSLRAGLGTYSLRK
jgi:predicted double-glycine peptidase